MDAVKKFVYQSLEEKFPELLSERIELHQGLWYLPEREEFIDQYIFKKQWHSEVYRDEIYYRDGNFNNLKDSNLFAIPKENITYYHGRLKKIQRIFCTEIGMKSLTQVPVDERTPEWYYRVALAKKSGIDLRKQVSEIEQASKKCFLSKTPINEHANIILRLIAERAPMVWLEDLNWTPIWKIPNSDISLIIPSWVGEYGGRLLVPHIERMEYQWQILD